MTKPSKQEGFFIYLITFRNNICDCWVNHPTSEKDNHRFLCG